ncbi:hypothetical protein NKR23_g1073 [Pleurostoma richardsiae]|uniref:Uncharacterized protein n=1 Tax=Pleurostoma richardsiae TaxID=41990 RepID=A0AA38VZT6_9PEZI|nr:hypothetical protein NKR23_g1073 [Pleurostoma richardsiae]
MFSPANTEGGPAMATRSRRRQRPLSSDSLVQQPKAKRQRLPLTEQTFVNPDAQPEMLEVKPDRSIAKLNTRPDGIENVAVIPRRELSVRSKKPKAAERTSKGDGSVVLTTNNAYTVSKLPALPDRIRADSSSRQHGTICSSNGYALSLSHTHALIWPYTTVTPSPETFVFTLPYPSKHASDPLPLGCMVSPSAANDEPGLVVVMPISGKITYWESISSAATLDFLRQQRHGVEETIPGMFTGEHVVQMTNAESTGFILAFSTGRLAHVSVRDSQGKPAISVQFLRGSLGQATGGLFGSIRHVLKQAVYRGDIAAVRTGGTNKVGPRNVVAATKSGKLHAWRVHRGGHHETLVDVDAREAIVNALQQIDPGLNNFKHDTFDLLDFTFVPRGIEKRYTAVTRFTQAIDSEDDSIQHLLLLISFNTKRQSLYALVEVILSDGGITVGMIRTLESYFSPTSASSLERPRLYLPKPALVAFIVFDRAAVIASLARPPVSPDSQLQEETHVLPASFEDVIDLRSDDTLEVVGSGMEEPFGHGQELEGMRLHRPKTKNPAALLMIRGVGIVRIALTDIDRFASEEPPKVTAKSKLEQAVFFGIKDDNPLVFEGRRDLKFSSEEIGTAALELSRDILGSSSTYLSSLPAALEYSMRQRLTYLDRLMSHLNTLKVDLSRPVKWGLLWNAEKMNAAIAIWKQHEQFLAERPDDSKKTIVSEIVEFIHEDEKKNPNRAIGEVDGVRHWFVNDVWRIEIFIPWAYQMIKLVHKSNLADERAITRFMYEAVHVTYGSLHGALEYRMRKLPFYGLASEDMEQGILVSDYGGLPEPWTSSFFITNNLKRLVELCHMWLHQHYPPQIAPGAPDPGLIESIREDLPNLTDQYLIALQEYSRWAATSDEEKAVQFGDHCAKLYSQDRYEKILKLKDYGLWDQAIEVGEKHHSLTAMAELVVEQILALRKEAEQRDTPNHRAIELKVTADAKHKQMTQFIDKYGKAFAFPAYERLLLDGGVQTVLDFAAADQQGYATLFLREKPELAKISWINDVEREQDIDHAAETLLNIGLTREQQLWNKKIELSLGKLAFLAEGAGGEATPVDPKKPDAALQRDDNLSKIERELGVINIQDQLYKMILPSISNAVDEAAEIVLAMEAHAPKIPKKHKILHQVLENALSRLIKHEALDALTLIDLLTLVHVNREEVEEEAVQDQFFMALRVASLSLKGDEQRQAKRLIWRRCFNRDDWSRINNTGNQADEVVLEALSLTNAYHTIYACCVYSRQEGEDLDLVKPSEALGVYTEGLDSRFNDMEENFREKLLDAMKWEDATLRKYVEHCQLNKWTQTALEAAQKTTDFYFDSVTAAGANANGNGNGSANGHSKTANGVASNGKA